MYVYEFWRWTVVPGCLVGVEADGSLDEEGAASRAGGRS